MLCEEFNERSLVKVKRKVGFVEGIHIVLIAMGFCVQNANELLFGWWRRLDSAAEIH